MGKKKKEKIEPKKVKNPPKQKKIKSKKTYSKAQELFLKSIHDLSLKDLGVLFNTPYYMRKKKQVNSSKFMELY